MHLLNSVPPSFTTIPINQTVNEDDQTIFHCAATGNPTPRITWIKDGNTVGKGDPLSFDTKRNHTGEYWCSAENGLGLAINTSAYLNVQCKYQRYLAFDGKLDMYSMGG